MVNIVCFENGFKNPPKAAVQSDISMCHAGNNSLENAGENVH